MDQIKKTSEELQSEEDKARELDQSTTERGDHSSFRPFEVQTLGGQVVRHKSEDRNEDHSAEDDRVEYVDEQGNTIGFGDLSEQPVDEEEFDYIDINEEDDLEE